MKLEYAIAVSERLVGRLREISARTGNPDDIEACLFDARVLADQLAMNKALRRKWEDARLERRKAGAR